MCGRSQPDLAVMAAGAFGRALSAGKQLTGGGIAAAVLALLTNQSTATLNTTAAMRCHTGVCVQVSTSSRPQSHSSPFSTYRFPQRGPPSSRSGRGTLNRHIPPPCSRLTDRSAALQLLNC